jgi:hypothetical protein
MRAVVVRPAAFAQTRAVAALGRDAVAPDIAVPALALALVAARQSRATRSMALKQLRLLVDVAAQCDGVPAAGNGALDGPLALDGGKEAVFEWKITQHR